MSHPFEKLVAVMAKLRDPDGGCPWDLEQNFESIVPYTIEEAYEVADAVDRGSMADLKEELGDLLFQSVYHAQMASEAGHFDINEVINGVTEKMISRHPHVFSDANAESASDVNKIWDQKKNEEKTHTSTLDGIPKAFPALLRAKKLQSRAAKTGFEWAKLDQVLDKMEEELAELRVAVSNNDTANIKEEIGDLLFVIVNFARMQDIDAEESLRQCNEKFERRFHGMEEDFKDEGKNLSGQSLDAMTAMWNRQKTKE